VEIHRVLREDRKLDDDYTTAAGTRDDAVVLMHSPMGVRICLNIREQRLELWISPQARKSIDARLRNFSNRDDYTCIFDRIAMPGLDGESFVRCRYDPFYSVIEYEHQTLHLLSLAGEPGVAVWFDAPEVIDFKSDKQDTRTIADQRAFAVRHPDRGLTLEFAAVLGQGDARFEHQKECDYGRSTYARAEVQPGQVLLIGGELETESPARRLGLLAGSDGPALVEANEELVAPLLSQGRAIFRDRDDWQAQYDLNRRVLLSCQDYGGAMPAALRALYYLIWHMDGALTAVSAGYCGWQDFLGRWALFEASNPTEGARPGGWPVLRSTGHAANQQAGGMGALLDSLEPLFLVESDGG
jgi:hypothetical protein